MINLNPGKKYTVSGFSEYNLNKKHNFKDAIYIRNENIKNQNWAVFLTEGNVALEVPLYRIRIPINNATISENFADTDDLLIFKAFYPKGYYFSDNCNYWKDRETFIQDAKKVLEKSRDEQSKKLLELLIN